MRRTLQVVATVSLALGCSVLSHASPPTNLPPQSVELREEFAACRTKASEIKRFACICDVVGRQCEAALHPDHGMWRTIEFWPTDQLEDREVYFHLAPNPDDIFTMDAWDQAILTSCIDRKSVVVFHLGDVVDVTAPIGIWIDGERLDTQIVDEAKGVMAVASDNMDAKERLRVSNSASIEFFDEWGDPVQLDFDTQGYDAVTANWEAVCESSTS